jgi:excisionase family DNA binding protein
MTFAQNFIGRQDVELHIIGQSCNASESESMTHLLLDAQEAAQILRMDRRTLVRWARIGYVPAHPLGEGKRKLWRFREHELLAWVEARETEKKRPPASTINAAISAHARRSA